MAIIRAPTGFYAWARTARCIWLLARLADRTSSTSDLFGSGRYVHYLPRACRFIRSYVHGVADANAPPPRGMFPSGQVP